MKRLTVTLTFALLAACASVPSGATAARAAITTYVDVYQPAVIAYGHLPVCGSFGSGSICHDLKVYADLKAADAAATKSIVAANDIIGGGGSENDLDAAIAAVVAAERIIASKGVLK